MHSFVFVLLSTFTLVTGISKRDTGTCDGKLEPESILVSSIFDPRFGDYGVDRSRLDTTEEVIDNVIYGGAWVAGVKDTLQWIKWELPDGKNVTGVVTQGREDEFFRMRVTRYRVSYSNDDENWTCIMSAVYDNQCERFLGNSDHDSKVINTFNVPIQAKYVRIEPVLWRNRIALRLGLLGCDIPRCVSSCVGVPNGDYQSCLGCQVYITCSNDIAHDNRPCAAANLFWDDNLKRCEYSSTTCP